MLTNWGGASVLEVCVLVGVGVGEREGTGIGDVVADNCFFQASFLPFFTQIKIEPVDFLTCPTFVHNAPALTAAFAWIAGMDTREIEISATISFWGARTGEVSQDWRGETIT